MAVEVYQREGERIEKQLLKNLMVKNVHGFCQEVKEAIKLLKVDCFDELVKVKDIRKHLKKKLIKIQGNEIMRRMTLGSKTDELLLNNFQYNGKIKKYLVDLKFDEAKVIFLFRTRMFPTRANYPGRWSSIDCKFCGNIDNDKHLFRCPGYVDLMSQDTNYEMFFKIDHFNVKEMEKAAKCLLKIKDRLEKIQDDEEVNIRK